MSSAFYNRFNNKNIEAFSDDIVFSAFSKTDADYKDAVNARTCTPDKVCTDDIADCRCEYKNKVDELVKLKSTYGYSQKNLEDNNEIYSSVTMDNINLGIGILIMLATISYMNDII
jgi:hypothetical protein